ncbi:MAG: hypothetical protein P1U32_08490 [Legionellaceae bacterium]|nr:hypothetical protein [Legionellaceae bacterium]
MKYRSIVLFLVGCCFAAPGLCCQSAEAWCETTHRIIDEVLVTHNVLNPSFWDKEQLKKTAEDDIIRLAHSRFKSLKAFIPGIELSNVLITGSMCNYNYNAYSDIDVQLLVDLSHVKDDIMLTKARIHLINTLWKLEYRTNSHLKLSGYPMQLLVREEAWSEPAGGVYSLFERKWRHPPVYHHITFTNEALFKSVEHYHTIYLTLVKQYTMNPTEANCQQFQKLSLMLHALRTRGIVESEDGLYSLENYTYRTLNYLGEKERIAQALSACQLGVWDSNLVDEMSHT